MSGTEDTACGNGAAAAPALRGLRQQLAQLRRQRRSKGSRQGWLVGELARLAGVPVRTVHHYVARQLLLPPEFAGRQTRYDRLHLLRLVAVPLLKAQGHRRIRELRGILDGLGEPGLSALVRGSPLPSETREALGWEVPPPHVDGFKDLPAGTELAAFSSFDAAMGESFEPWQRLTLVPGLELMLRADATAFVKSVAEQIRERYSAH